VRNLIARFAVWLAAQSGVILVQRPSEGYLASALQFAKHVESQPEPWEWKQRQVLRALMNRFPKAKVRDLNLAIEIVVQECSVSGR